MKSARQAGWLCLAGGIIFVPLAIALHRLMGSTALSVVSGYVAFLFWLAVVMSVISFIYAACLKQSTPARRSMRTGNYSTAKGNKRP